MNQQQSEQTILADAREQLSKDVYTLVLNFVKLKIPNFMSSHTIASSITVQAISVLNTVLDLKEEKNWTE